MQHQKIIIDLLFDVLIKMQFKLFVVALLGACVLQVTFTQAASEDVVEDALEDVVKTVDEDVVENPRWFGSLFKNKANAAINTITSLTKTTFNKASKGLNDIKNQATVQADRAKEEATKQLKDVIGKADGSIKKILDKATELQIDISPCALNIEKRFEQLLKTLLADILKCVTNELNSALKIINYKINTINDAFSAVVYLPEDLAECGGSSTCIMNIIYEVGKLQLQVPAQITKSVAAATQFVAGLPRKLQLCAAIQVARAGVETAKIVVLVTKCALAKGVKRSK